MGQNNSAPLGGRRRSFRSSWRPRFPPRSCSHKGNLSATFNVLDIDTKIDLLNVNLASEEELMTLPGVSRTDAHNIVEYRQRLGRFKKVEDLALVSGIGADKLALIRPEICVGPRRSPSCASSRAQSIDSLPSMDAKPSPRPIPLTNVNTATVFDLQAIPGFTQEIAANVIDYRDKHGNFSNLEQLTKVRGLNHIRLGAVRSRLSVNEEQNTLPIRNGCPPGLNIFHSTPKNSPKLSSSHSSQPIANGKISGHRKTMSVPVKFGPVSNGLAVRDILDVLSACSPRPIVEDHFDGKRKGRPAIRIATWSLSGLSVEKAENPGVREVICRTILENRFSLVALQDALSIEAVEKICNELNFPSLRRTKEWKENSHKWQHQSSKGLGFIWDSNDAISLSAISAVKLCDSDDSSEVLLANFMIGSFEVSMVNVNLGDYCPNDNKSNILDEIQKHSHKHLQYNLIISGNFSTVQKKLEDCSALIGDDLKGALPLKVSTNSTPLNHLTVDTPFNDNIFLSKTISVQYTGKSGVVRQGLAHLAIPHNWSWGGPASEHCPVWCEMYIDKKPSSPCETKNSS